MSPFTASDCATKSPASGRCKPNRASNPAAISSTPSSVRPWACVLLLSALLLGCGQSGDLYLPEATPSPTPAALNGQ
ncbi:MAG: LPS translocon maturation chaperone LptM [Oceanococcaceae bacterium]